MKMELPDKEKMFAIIFRSDTPAGKQFDIYLLYAIGLSVLILILNSIPSLNRYLSIPFLILEWALTLAFTAEYLLRIYCSKNAMRYIFSFYGIVDALSIFPFYLGIIFPSMQSVAVIRILRVLRVFRILNMGSFMQEASILLLSLRKSLRKIVIFMMFVFITAIILGSFMYAIEGDINPNLSSIPKGIYWAIVTLTTVGYGDITPLTDMGQIVAGIMMILGYSVIAVPTGIISADIISTDKKSSKKKKHNADDEEPLKRIRSCPNCGWQTEDQDADYCKRCGTEMVEIR
ncbi:MAG: ion transporter [Bacteroidales bacterium]|nr:ion transporter [Bacteroidales bacterium]